MRPIDKLLALTPKERATLFASMSPDSVKKLLWSREFWARADQIWEPTEAMITMWLFGRGGGKLLDLDTPIPTPDGWVRNGDLKVGSVVFDERGRMCNVLAVYDETPERAWRVGFSDSTHIDAGGEHLWQTWTHRDRKAWNRGYAAIEGGLPEEWATWKHKNWQRGTEHGPEVRTTDQIVATLRHSARQSLSHSIPTCDPLETPTEDLLVEPWVLGYWLGNGTRGAGAVTTHPDDLGFVMDGAKDAGYKTKRWSERTTQAPCINLLGLRTQLKGLAVLREKHVPDAYLWSSSSQRLALLRGLMDSDGYAGGSSVEFCSMDRALADGVLHLARSLGEKPVLGFGRAMLNGKDYGEKYRVTWRPTRNNPFSLPRKMSGVRKIGAQASRNYHRMITSVEPIEVVPMRCITVDSPSHLYLAGEGMVPTHNTWAGSHTIRHVAENPWLCGGRRKRNDNDTMNGRGGVIGIAGRTANDVNETILYGPSGLMTISPPWFRPVHNRQAMTLTWPNGCKARLFSGDVPESFRGPNIGFLWCDELPHWKRLAASWDQAMFTLRHGKKPRCIVTTTPLGVPTLLDIMFERDEDGNLIPDADALDGYRLKPESEVRVIRGSSHDNRDHLAKSYLEMLDTKHSGTRLGAQEVGGVVLIGNPNSIWKLENFRRCDTGDMPKMDLIVVAVDPAVGTDPTSGSETGIAVMGIAEGQLWLLEDGSGEYTESQWAQHAIALYTKWDADAIVGENNQGGNLVGANVRHHAPKYSRIRFEDVRASKSKTKRARLVSGLWEQSKVVHVGDSRTFLACEHQMTQFDPRKAEKKQATDRMDAVVWGALWLLGNNDDRAGVAALGSMDNWRELMAKLGRG